MNPKNIAHQTHHRIDTAKLIQSMSNVGQTALSTLKNNGLRLVFRNENGATAIAVKSGQGRKELASLPIEGGTFIVDGVNYNLVRTTETGDIGAPAAWKLYTMTEVPCSIQGKIPAAASLSRSTFGDDNIDTEQDNDDTSIGDKSEDEQMAMLAQLFGEGSPMDSPVPAGAGGASGLRK